MGEKRQSKYASIRDSQPGALVSAMGVTSRSLLRYLAEWVNHKKQRSEEE